MKKSRYTEAQIIKVLKEVEGGRQVKEAVFAIVSLMSQTPCKIKADGKAK